VPLCIVIVAKAGHCVCVGLLCFKLVQLLITVLMYQPNLHTFHGSPTPVLHVFVSQHCCHLYPAPTFLHRTPDCSERCPNLLVINYFQQTAGTA